MHSKIQQTAEVLNPYLQTAGQSAIKASQKAKESASHYLSPLGTLVGSAASKAKEKVQEVGAVAAQKYQERMTA